LPNSIWLRDYKIGQANFFVFIVFCFVSSFVYYFFFSVAIIYKLDIRNMKQGNSFHTFPDTTEPGLAKGAKGASGVKGSSVTRMYGNITKEKTLASRSKAENRGGIEKIKEEEEGDDELGRWHSVGERKEEEEGEKENENETEGEKRNGEITSSTETKEIIDVQVLEMTPVKKRVGK
tara:strand:- start:80 stop:610 length:531 start_codon:yes stop_codon:yes gene_type:complete